MTTRNAETNRANNANCTYGQNHLPVRKRKTIGQLFAMLQSMQEQLKTVQGIPAQLKSFNDRLGALEGERKETSIDFTSNGLNNRPREQIQQPLTDLALHIERADEIRIWADEYFTEQI